MARTMRYKMHNSTGPTKDNPYPGMQAFLLSPKVQHWADEAARDVARRAGPITPRSNKEDGEHLADAFHTEEIEPQVYDGNPRRAARVVNRKRYAAAVEFGSKTNEGHRMLARAAAEVGEFHPGRRKEGP